MNRTFLTLGPLLFNWAPDIWRDFYLRIADEASFDTVYLGEVICSKRAPFIEPFYPEVVERLCKGGKQIVFSTLTEVMLPREREMVASMCGMKEFDVEANDATALYHLKGQPHRVGSFVNVYSEDTLCVLAARGARHFTLAPEISKDALPILAATAKSRGLTLELQVYGRIPLALSARCYHARAHGRTKDNCQFVCGEDPDGMELHTTDNKNFLAVNGIQTLSHACLNLMNELTLLQTMGISSFRLSPHSHDMVKVSSLFRAVLDGKLDAQAASKRLEKVNNSMTFANGFFHHKPGHAWIGSA